MRQLDEIVVHCAATRPQWMESSTLAQQVAEIRSWHKAKKWKDIAYHYVIGRDGKVAKGRPDSQQGAHVLGRNRTTLGVCLIGGHGAAADDEFFEHFTPQQGDALEKLLDELTVKYGIVKITGHNRYANKGCPGFNVTKWLADRAALKRAPRPTPRPKAEGGFAALIRALLSIFGRKS